MHYQSDNSRNHDTIDRHERLDTSAPIGVNLFQETPIFISLIEIFLEKLSFAAYGFYRQSQLTVVIELIKALSRLVSLHQAKVFTITSNWVQDVDSQGNVLDIYNYARHYQRVSYRYLNQQFLFNSPITTKFNTNHDVDDIKVDGSTTTDSDHSQMSPVNSQQTYVGR